MVNAPTDTPKLMMMRSEGGSELVMVRRYGSLLAIALDDQLTEHSLVRVPEAIGPKLLTPYHDTNILEALSEQYDQLQNHLAETGQIMMGPLFFARAAVAMKERGMTAAEAITEATACSDRLIEANRGHVEAAKHMQVTAPQ